METKHFEEGKFEEGKRYLKAKSRVKQIQKFYWHLFWYVAVIIFFLVLIYGGFEDKGKVFQFVHFLKYESRSWNILWFWLPMAIWSVVILIQGLYVFGNGSNWEERKIREILDKDKF